MSDWPFLYPFFLNQRRELATETPNRRPVHTFRFGSAAHGYPTGMTEPVPTKPVPDVPDVGPSPEIPSEPPDVGPSPVEPVPEIPVPPGYTDPTDGPRTNSAPPQQQKEGEERIAVPDGSAQAGNAVSTSPGGGEMGIAPLTEDNRNTNLDRGTK